MKCKFKKKYKPLSEATPEELREAIRIASYWLTDVLEDNTEVGAFSEANLGEVAILYFPKRAYLTLKDPNCRWHWKEGSKLSSLMINVIKSDMAHTLRDYMLNGEPIVRANSEFECESADEDGWDDSNDLVEVEPELKQNGFQMVTDEEKLAELERYESRRDAGYRIARQAAKGNPQFEKYVEAVFTLPDERSVCKRMKMTKAEVAALEEELIVKIKVVLKES